MVPQRSRHLSARSPESRWVLPLWRNLIIAMLTALLLALNLQSAATGAPLPAAPVAPQVVPPATGDNAVITVKVGGDRIGTQAVAPLAGVQLGLYDTQTGGTAVFTCTSDADGDCSFTIPRTGVEGPNLDRRFFVRQIGVPDGWFANPTLRTGDASGADSELTPYSFQTGPQLRAGTVYSSTNQFMLGTGSTNRQASGGIWQQSRINPEFPVSCGLDVALILDYSGSVAPFIDDLKAATDTFVNSLIGTPARMAVFSFSEVSPANLADQNYPDLRSVATPEDAAAFKAQYEDWEAFGSTNWDRGIYSAAEATDTYDIAVVITDGSPSAYNDPREGPYDFNRVRAVENGIFSANALKAEGTRVIVFGVGSGAEDTATAVNLAAISGPVKYDGVDDEEADFYQTDNYAAAGNALRRLALSICEGSVSVTKQIVPLGTTGEDVTGAKTAGAGWEFAATTTTAGVTVTPTTGTTTADGTGTVTFEVDLPGGTSSADVTVNETQQDGFDLVTQNGDNAVCRDRLTEDPVAVTNDDTDPATPGFTVAAAGNQTVSCVIYNRPQQPPADVTVDKVWVINGTEYAQGEQPSGFTSQLSLTGPDGAGATRQGWDVPRSGYRITDVTTLSETNTLAWPLCVLTSSRLTEANGTAVDAAVPYDATLTQPENSYVITTTVTCNNVDVPTTLTLRAIVEGGGSTPADWTLTATPDGIAGQPVVSGNGDPGSPGGVNVEPVQPGTYDLSEDGPPGFAIGEWECVEAEVTDSAAEILVGTDVVCTIIITPLPGEWTLNKSSDPESGSTVQPGSTVTYTLTVTNTSDAAVNDAVVTDDLSGVLDNASLVSVPDGASLSETTLTWTVPPLAAEGDVATLTYQVEVDADAYDVTLTNAATPGEGGTCVICTTTVTTRPPVVPPGPDVPPLPDTGGPGPGLLAGGLFALAAGAAFLIWSRRRRMT